MAETNYSGQASSLSRGLLSQIEQANPEMVSAAQVQRAWYNCMDDVVVSHTDAVFVIPDTNCSQVIVYVDNNIWATEMNMQAELFRLKLNLELQRMDEASGKRHRDEGALLDAGDPEKVKRLKFILSKEKYRSRKKVVQSSTADQLLEEAPYDVEPVELTKAEDDELRKRASAISDERLREAAYAAMKADLQLKKALSTQ